MQQKSPIEGGGQVMTEAGLKKCEETPILLLSNIISLLEKCSPLFARVVL